MTQLPRRLAAPRVSCNVMNPNRTGGVSAVVALVSAVLLLLLLLSLPTSAAAAAAAPKKQLTCADADGDGNSFCSLTPGYKLKVSSPIADPTILTTSNCCERDDSRAAFGACDAPGSAGGAGAGAVQAPTEGDTSWLFQDGAGFAQVVDKFTGLCFSVLINPTDCTDSGDPLAAPKCCTKKPPATLQFKIATADASSVQPGSKRAGALANLSKCGISWAPGSVITTRGLKRVTKWEKVDAKSDRVQYFNVPATFPAKARQATFCLYTNGLADATMDCSWESICGLADGSVPLVGASASSNGVGAADNEYAQGCEVRLVGKKAPTMSQCCSPPMSLVSFDSGAGNDDPNPAPAVAATMGGGGSSKGIRLAAGAKDKAGGKKAAAIMLRRGRSFV